MDENETVVSGSDETAWMGGYTVLWRSGVGFLIGASAIASFLALTMIVAVTIPLFRRKRRNRSSTYNVYLVFLAVPELVYTGFLVYLFATFDRWTGEPRNGDDDDDDKFPVLEHPFDAALFCCCGTVSMYLNAIIANEILRLLRHSKLRKRYKAPNLKTAMKQAGCTYALGITVFLLDFYLIDLIYEHLEKHSKVWIKEWFIIPLNLAIMYLAPMFYLLWVCFRIGREGLFFGDSIKTGERLTVLVRYFARIILVYVGLGIPVTILYMFKVTPTSNPGLFFYGSGFIYAIQVIASFALALTKPDVRKNVLSLFRCYRKRRPAPAEKLPGPNTAMPWSTSGCGCGGTESGGSSKKLRCDDEDDRHCSTTSTTTEPDVAAAATTTATAITTTVPEPEDGPGGGGVPSVSAGVDHTETVVDNVNVFDFAGADAPIEIDPHERQVRRQRSRFAHLRRHHTEGNPLRSTTTTMEAPTNERRAISTGVSRPKKITAKSEPTLFDFRPFSYKKKKSSTHLTSRIGPSTNRLTNVMPSILSERDAVSETDCDDNNAGSEEPKSTTDKIEGDEDLV